MSMISQQIRAVVFDMGGTLMEYTGMPLSWSRHYPQAFRSLAAKLEMAPSDERILQASERLAAYNPRLTGRQREYTPEKIFADVLQDWPDDLPISDCIEEFWRGMGLCSTVYPQSVRVLSELRRAGYRIAVLTDLPSAMPDEIFRREIAELEPYIDMYVSSAVAGYRKPNPAGLRMIADAFRLSADEMVFIGDEEKDRITAQNFGCGFISVGRDTSGLDRLI